MEEALHNEPCTPLCIPHNYTDHNSDHNNCTETICTCQEAEHLPVLFVLLKTRTNEALASGYHAMSGMKSQLLNLYPRKHKFFILLCSLPLINSSPQRSTHEEEKPWITPEIKSFILKRQRAFSCGKTSL